MLRLDGAAATAGDAAALTGDAALHPVMLSGACSAASCSSTSSLTVDIMWRLAAGAGWPLSTSLSDAFSKSDSYSL
jgi:hypothetical protein